MKYFRLSGIVALAALALSAIAAATASADNSALLLLAGEVGSLTFLATGGAGTLSTAAGQTITCTSTVDTGEAESEGTNVRLGLATLDFFGCKLTKGETKVACNTEGDVKETLLFAKIPFHLVDVLEGTKLQAGFAFLFGLTPFKIKCGAVAIVEFKGTPIGLIKCEGTQECLAEKPKVGSEATKAIISFIAAGETCDTSGTLCAQYKKEEPFLANFSGAFEEAKEVTEATATMNKMFFVDD